MRKIAGLLFTFITYTTFVISDLQLSQFDYKLPPELIAQQPSATRIASRLLHLDAAASLHDRQFADFPLLLKENDLLVFNNTQVIKARLSAHKKTGGRVEVLVERVVASNQALAHIRSSKAPKIDSVLILEDHSEVLVSARQGALFVLQFNEPVLNLLERQGSLPLPPYIRHSAGPQDEKRYQTVYASQPGAVAAPTAGLHFDQAMLDRLKTQGVEQAFVTLHVGAGTFQPVRSERISEHVMHAERYILPADALQKITKARRNQGRVIAVGTTSARALESAAAVYATQANTVSLERSIEGDTQLFITPGYCFRWVDALLTNFHLPQSTLLMMVSALAGIEPIRRAYAHAIDARYRFFSYGDAMFIEPPQT